MASTSVEGLERKRNEVRKGLASIGDLRPGSLVERYRRCGKPSCHCAEGGSRGHGPSWSLTHAVGGKTVTAVIPANAVEQTRKHLAEYQRLRGLTRDLIDVNERLCDARFGAAETASEEAVKKGGSKRPSRPKSSRRSTRS